MSNFLQRSPGDRCPICDKPMIASSASYVVCPMGHGKLYPRGIVCVKNVAAEEREFKQRMDQCLPKN